jgi:hypothetical protein
VTSILRNRFTASSSYEVVETPNKQNYQEHYDWEFIAGKYKFDKCAASNQLATPEAINVGVRLRGEKFNLKKAA